MRHRWLASALSTVMWQVHRRAKAFDLADASGERYRVQLLSYLLLLPLGCSCAGLPLHSTQSLETWPLCRGAKALDLAEASWARDGAELLSFPHLEPNCICTAHKAFSRGARADEQRPSTLQKPRGHATEPNC